MAKREHKTPKKKFHIGDITKIQDKNGFLLHIGDKIKYGEYTGRFLLNYETPVLPLIILCGMATTNLVWILMANVFISQQIMVER